MLPILRAYWLRLFAKDSENIYQLNIFVTFLKPLSGFKFLIFLPQPPKFQEYKSVTPEAACVYVEQGGAYTMHRDAELTDSHKLGT